MCLCESTLMLHLSLSSTFGMSDEPQERPISKKTQNRIKPKTLNQKSINPPTLNPAGFVRVVVLVLASCQGVVCQNQHQ